MMLPRFLLFFALVCLVFSASAQNDQIVHKRNKYIFKGEDKLFKTRYDSIRNFSEGKAAVLKKGKWGFINDTGEAVIKCRYAAVTDFHGGLAAVQEPERGGWNIVNINCRRMSSSGYKSVEFIDSFAVADPGNSLDGHRNNEVYHYNNGSSEIKHVASIVPRENGYLFTYYGINCEYKSDVLTAQVFSSGGKSLTPVFLYNDSILKNNSIVTECDKHKVALLTPDLKVSKWYTNIYHEEYGLCTVRSGDYYGAINSSAAEIIPAEYSSCRFAGNNFIVKNHLGTRLYDTSGNTIGPHYTDIVYLGEGIYKVQYGFGYDFGLMKANGDTLSGHYQSIHEFNCGLALVTNADGLKFGYVNTSGTLTAGWYPRAIVYHPPHSYNDIGGTIFRIFMGVGSLGITEALQVFDGIGGEQTTPEHYTSDYGSDFRNGYTYYTVKRKAPSPNKYNQELVYYGVIDSTGKVVLPARYDGVKQIDTFLLVEINKSLGMYTRSGKQVLPVKYSDIDSLGHGYFNVESNGGAWSSALFKYDGVKGKFLTPFIYSGFSYGGDSTFIVDSWPEHGYMDYNGKILVRPKYRQAFPFQNGRAQVSFDHSGGLFYIDRNGKRIE